MRRHPFLASPTLLRMIMRKKNTSSVISGKPWSAWALSLPLFGSRASCRRICTLPAREQRGDIQDSRFRARARLSTTGQFGCLRAQNIRHGTILLRTNHAGGGGTTHVLFFPGYIGARLQIQRKIYAFAIFSLSGLSYPACSLLFENSGTTQNYLAAGNYYCHGSHGDSSHDLTDQQEIAHGRPQSDHRTKYISICKSGIIPLAGVE